ncbi:patatin-like phospholipase family protein [Siccirubricoccus sp. KC 17139]|uniref:Patatin-like phospholipase family protein n=1 Tax=Siccirubricoccus soli TaxID=2899147 RepID=A0ABT1D8G3_9PROT|nr:patatin-like phospholipase family protein [Siccirubricoccus soli]MCO6418159.1 patatin-like phospholipase family protein [Siccirubricoccus soli]MCP2684294.1 patatin-like phospholipase family protein [Siccirubricoccus soli]
MAEGQGAPAVARPVAPKKINLALQGGGTHGAFTWGVLERLLEDERLAVDAVSGTSAGGINAAILVQGLAAGGRQGAIDALNKLWNDVALRLAFSPLRNTPWEKALWGHDLTYSVAYQTFETLSRVFSPYHLNPLLAEFNPLRQVISENLDEARLKQDAKAIRLFISATNVRTGKPRVFGRAEVTTDVILASACLPNVFRAVEIEGEPYWDGGYLGNPALWPLYHERGAPDIVVVQINAILREELPTTPSDIMNRLNEISFNASLMAEMRAIDFVQRLLDAGRLEQPRYRRLFLHVIEDEARMREFKLSTKLNGDWEFLQTLKAYGREAADRFLADHFAAIGRESTLDIQRYL